MKKIAYYTYLGTNGTITSPIHLEDIYYTKKYKLVADQGCELKNKDNKTCYSVMVPEREVDEWIEINGQ